MYATSTQKRYWIYTPEELHEKRNEINQKYFQQHQSYLESEEQKELFLGTDEEKAFIKIVAETGIRFGKDFKPELPPAVRWTALMYYKRFYLKATPMDYAPKIVILTAHFLAAKVDEFYIKTEHFIKNIKSGDPHKNAEAIIKVIIWIFDSYYILVNI